MTLAFFLSSIHCLNGSSFTNNERYKVKVSCLCARHEGISGNGGIAPLNLGGKRSDSRFGRFTPEERASGTVRTVGYVGPSTGADAFKRRKSFTHAHWHSHVFFFFGGGGGRGRGTGNHNGRS
jgi:hypothetical protein